MITLSKSGNAVKFTFDENDHYLQNGTIEVPVNSLALIMDDSDMVTFRKSASNDIFVSANYSEFGMSKAELEAWYKTYMVGSSGGGGGTGGTTPEEVQQMIDVSLIPYSTTSEVDSMIDESVSGKADTSAVDALGNTVATHTADTTIHVTANEKAAWDAKSDFSGDYNDLTNKPTIPTVPTSNTAFTNDAGYITSSALDGYATEDYVTASTSTKLDVSTFETYSGNVETELDGKQPIGDYVTGSQMSAFTYDKATIDEKISEGGIFDPTQYYTTAQTYSKTETNSLLDEKLDATAYTPTDLSNYDTKSEVNTKIEQATSGKVDTSTFNTYSGNVASALDGKVDDAEIADMATKTWVGNQSYLTEHQDISGKLDVSAFTAYSGAVDTTINSKASQASVDALNGVVTAHTANTEIHVTSADKNAWNAKSDFSGSYNDLTNKLSAGTGISIVDNVISAEGGGGGKAVSGGTNISITTGETADTINCTLPISVHSNTTKGDILFGTDIGSLSDFKRLIIGRNVGTRANSGLGDSIGINIGDTSELYGSYSVGIGNGFKIGNGSQYGNLVSNCVAIGHGAKTRINDAVAIGKNTEASGTTKTNINNQLTIDTSNQVYIYNKDNTEMICLQDQLGGGGGKTIVGGRGIAITTGETADTISFNLSISAGTGNFSVKENTASLASGLYSHAEGYYTTASNNSAHAEGDQCVASGERSHAEGYKTTASNNSAHAEGGECVASGERSHAEGYKTTASTYNSHTEGYYTVAYNASEHSNGMYNVSNTGSTTADKTLFSVGNGTENARHNAFEIRQNGDIYIIINGQDVKLQDILLQLSGTTS